MDAHENVVELQYVSALPNLEQVVEYSCKAHTFSSPMVNLPCVSLFASANASSFLIGSVWDTETQNLTLALVYSWPGCISLVHFRLEMADIIHRPWCRPAELPVSHSMLCASRQRFLRRNDHSLFEESESAELENCHFFQETAERQENLTSNEQSISGEHNSLIPILHEVANAILGVARSMQSLH